MQLINSKSSKPPEKASTNGNTHLDNVQKDNNQFVKTDKNNSKSKNNNSIVENGNLDHCLKKKIVDEDEDESNNDSEIDSDDDEATETSHKETLERLKQKDPEFYKYLQQNDRELLEFNDDEDLLDDDDDDDEEAEDENEEKQEVEEDITLNVVNQWRQVLQNPSSKGDCLVAIKSIIKAFRKTVNQTTDTSDDFRPSSMNMLNPSVFNAIINTTLIDMVPALMRYLRLQNLKASKALSGNEAQETDEDEDDQNNDIDDNEEKQSTEVDHQTNNNQVSGLFFDPRRSRNWKRVISCVKVYLTDVLKMMDSLSSDARASFERHVLELTPFFNAFPHLIKRLIKRSIDEWSSGEERNRVLAFLVLHRSVRVIHSNDHLTVAERQTLINQILRRLYLSYVSVARNTNESTISHIGFMKNSLAELYSLDDQLAYQHAFIFIRQLAINLRNSYILKQKDALKTVYNWQYVHSILLWSHLICSANSRTDVLQPLISPLVMVITGTIKLLPSTKFIPLRFHLLRSLIRISAESDTYIPVLRHILEIYDHFDPGKSTKQTKNQKNKKDKSGKKDKLNGESKKKFDDDDDDDVSDLSKTKKSNKSKEINLEVMLKVQKEQTVEMEFAQKVIVKLYELTLYYVTTQSASISFPEMVSIFLYKSRKFVKRIRLSKERTMIKQLLDKITENSNFIFQKRKSVDFTILEMAKLAAWERELKQSGATPLAKFFKQYKHFKTSLNNQKSISDNKSSIVTVGERANTFKIAAEELTKSGKKREFNVESDIQKPKVVSKLQKEKNVDQTTNDVAEDEELDDEDLDEEMEFEDDDEDSISEFGSDDDKEITAEEMAKIQKKIEQEEKNLRKVLPKEFNNGDVDDGSGEENGTVDSDGGVEENTRKRKRKNRNKNKKKKARPLNSDLQLEGAFDMSSDEDDD